MNEPGAGYLLFKPAIGGDWAGRHGIGQSAFPHLLDIDSIRAVKQTGGYSSAR